MTHISFQVLKTDLHQTRLTNTEPVPLQNGEVRVAVQRFALTANNITYAAFGDAMNYWKFFPASDAMWGNIPVWGFADVTQSRCEGVAIGERFYGYYPMASHATLLPARVSDHGFADAAPHRADLHPVYNQYVANRTDSLYSADTENIQALLRPLFVTSFLIEDFLADSNFFGANTLLLSSASSKTAYGTAFQLAGRNGVEVVGLTSAANAAFCASLGCYTRVLTYEQLGEINADTACVYVDFAGNAKLRHTIHSRFAQLKYSCSIGGAHVNALGGAKDLPGVRATLFFAPAQIKKRGIDWGAAGLRDRLGAAWQAFTVQVMQPHAPWLVVQEHSDSVSFDAVYQEVLQGNGDPRVGHILTF